MPLRSSAVSATFVAAAAAAGAPSLPLDFPVPLWSSSQTSIPVCSLPPAGDPVSVCDLPEGDDARFSASFPFHEAVMQGTPRVRMPEASLAFDDENDVDNDDDDDHDHDDGDDGGG